ncbi:MAG: hypothetical protein GF364_20140 [Candidatus Lokiarchaeota archaeon]|nr:hypothetical protein [Candidatus Lokiarchaeota archaeon]
MNLPFNLTSTKKKVNSHILRKRIRKINVFIVIMLVIPIFSYFNSLSTVNLSLNNPNLIRVNPESSALTADYNITITGLSTYSAYHGDIVTLYGHADEWDYGATAWVNSQFEEIHAVINGEPDLELTDLTNGVGNFEIEIPVEDYYNIYSDLKLEANVTDQDTWTPRVWFPQYLDINANCELINDEEEQLPVLKYTSIPYGGFTNYNLRCGLQLDNGSMYDGPAINLDLDYGSGIIPISVDGEGYAEYNIFCETSFTTYSWDYAGNANLSNPDAVSGSFKFLNDISIDFLDTELTAYQNYSYDVRARVTPDDDLENGLDSIGVRITFLGLTEVATTNENGVFSITFEELPDDFIGSQTLTVEIINYNGEDITGYGGIIEGGIPSDFTSIQVKAPTAFDNPNAIPLEIIILIIVIAGGVVGLIIFMRWRLKRESEIEKQKMMSSIEERLVNVRLLQQAGRTKEAMGYLWIVYAQLAAIKYGIEKKTSDTPKKFAMILVREYGQNPASIYSFIQFVERAVFGFTPVTEQYFQEVIKRFRQLYHELTGHGIQIQV